MGYDFSMQGSKLSQAGLGFTDAERKLNLNALRENNAGVLVQLLGLLGADPETARGITAAVVDWKDEDSATTHSPDGAEEDYYSRLPRPYRCKNRAFDNVEELLLVRGMTPEIFQRLKDYVTVFPKNTESSFLVNSRTASTVVLKALGRALAAPAARADIQEVEQWVDAWVAGRDSLSGESIFSEGNLEKLQWMRGSSNERLWAAFQPYFIEASEFLSGTVLGYDRWHRSLVTMDFIIDRKALSVVDWRVHEGIPARHH